MKKTTLLFSQFDFEFKLNLQSSKFLGTMYFCF